MTFWLLVAGSVGVLWGTRSASLVFVGAAVAAGFEGGSASLLGVWMSATAAGILLVGGPVRRLALPVLGAAAALVALQAPNAAAVLPAWAVATGAAVLGRGTGDAPRPWALSLLLADVPVVAAVVWTVLERGFVGWPGTLETGPALLLLAGVVLRAPLGAGAVERESEAGLVAVRAQVIALFLLATSTGDVASHGVLVAGAVLFAGGALAARIGMRDAAQEAGLAGMALGATSLGWMPSGWAWGALAAGTLLHLIRLPRRAEDPLLRSTRDLVFAGAVASPLLAVAAALGAAAVGEGDLFGAGVLASIGVGLAGRVAGGPGGAVATRGSRWTPVRGVRPVLLGLAVAFGLWAPLGTVPRPPAGAPVPWPWVGWLALILVGVIAGGRYARALAPARTARVGGPGMPTWVHRPLDGLEGLAGRSAALVVPFILLVLVAAAVWALGWFRGFL